MSEERMNFTACDEMVAAFEKVIATPVTHKSSVYYTGVDLGTACVVIAVLDENKQPIAGAMRYADVVRDGMVVDYIGAVQIVRELKEEIESKLGVELVYAAGAIPPGTDTLDGGAVKNVIEGAGFECTNLLDESTAANLVLQMKNGAVVDIGGGTTGISIFKDATFPTSPTNQPAAPIFRWSLPARMENPSQMPSSINATTRITRSSCRLCVPSSTRWRRSSAVT